MPKFGGGFECFKFTWPQFGCSNSTPMIFFESKNQAHQQHLRFVIVVLETL